MDVAQQRSIVGRSSYYIDIVSLLVCPYGQKQLLEDFRADPQVFDARIGVYNNIYFFPLIKVESVPFLVRQINEKGSSVLIHYLAIVFAKKVKHCKEMLIALARDKQVLALIDDLRDLSIAEVLTKLQEGHEFLEDYEVFVDIDLLLSLIKGLKAIIN